MHIVIPCKSLKTGKSRLSSCLDPESRQDLCRRLLAQALECALQVSTPGDIRLVTADPQAAALARNHSIATVRDPGGGLNAALDAARANLLAESSGHPALLVMPIDLPFASAAAIREAQAHAGDVIIAADQCGSGTNLLLLRGKAVQSIGFCYGQDSYALHLAQARRNGFVVGELKDWRLAFDIDNAKQYATWRAGMAGPS